MENRVLEAASSYETFLAAPLGRYFADARMLAWCATPTLCGFSFWGRVTLEDVERLAQPIERPKPAPIADRVDVLLDVSRVEAVDVTTFDALLTAMRRRTPAYAQRVARMAVVRPHGLIGALAEGIGNLVLPQHEWRVLDAQASALAWLGHESRTEVLTTIAALVEHTSGQSPLLAPLRRWLGAQHQRRVSLDIAARALGQSRRSLQRTLTNAGTSFKAELDRQLLLDAHRLLHDSDEKLETIALRLGFSSLSSFGVFYRRKTGKAPSTSRRAA